MNLSCNKPITSGAGETLTITCFTCGMPSSKEWAQKVRSRPSSTHLKSYYPFLLQIHPPHGAALKEDGSTFVCAFCHASLEAQWKNYERQPTGIPPMNRKYNLYKFICAVCGVETYRKRVRTLPFQEFPFLANQRPAGSLTLGNNPLAIVCLDCSETLWAQSAEYDRWGLPVHKRMFNWMARPPPPEDSVEATVARLPSGETQLPRCPPIEPIIVPKHKDLPPSAYLATKKTPTTKVRNSLSESSSSGNEPTAVRKTSLTSTAIPVLEASGVGIHSQSSQPPVVTVAPMSAHSTTLSSIRKETLSVPPNLNAGVYQKYENISVPSQLSHPHPLFPRSPLFSTSSYGPHGHPFSWSALGGREVAGGAASIGDHYAYTSSAAAAAAAAAAESLQAASGTASSWSWMPPPPSSSNLMQYQNFMPSSFSSRSYNLNEQFYNSSHSFYPPCPESNSNNSNSNLPIPAVASSPSTSTSSTYPYGFRTSQSARSSSPVPGYSNSVSAPSTSHGYSTQSQKFTSIEDPDLPLHIPSRKSLPTSGSSTSANRERDCGPLQEISSETVKRKGSSDDGGGKTAYKMTKNSGHTSDNPIISYRGAAMPKKLLSKTNHNHNATSDTTGARSISATAIAENPTVASGKEISLNCGNEPLPTNFKPKSNAIRNHMNEKEKASSHQNQLRAEKHVDNFSKSSAPATKNNNANGPSEVPSASAAVSLPVPKKWQWQSQYNNSRITTAPSNAAATATITSPTGFSSANNTSCGDGRRGRRVSESEPMDFSVVNRSQSSLTNQNTNADTLNRKLSDDEGSPYVNDVMDLSVASTSRQYSSSNNHSNTNSSSKPVSALPAIAPRSSKKFMIAYLCQSETSSDSPPHCNDNGGQYKVYDETEAEEQSLLSPARVDAHLENNNEENADSYEVRSRPSSRSNSSEPSGRRSVIVTVPVPNAQQERDDCAPSLFSITCHPKRRKRLRQRRDRKGQSQDSDRVKLNRMELEENGNSNSSKEPILSPQDDSDNGSESMSFSVKKKIHSWKKRKSDDNRVNLNEKGEENFDWSVNESMNEKDNDKHVVTAEATEVSESDTPVETTTNSNAKAIVDYQRAQEYAKKVVGEYKLEERQTRILKKKLEEDQEEFLSSLGLITLQKKSDLELNVLIQRSNHYTLPPLKFRPSTPPKVQLSEEFEKKLLQIAFDDPSLNKKSDLSSDEVTFLAQLDLKPASIPEKNKREKEWRIILTERMMREKRGRYLRGAKKPWDSYCGASKLLTPTLRPPCDSALDFFGSLSLTLPTEKNDFTFSNPDRSNGSSDLLRIAQNCSTDSTETCPPQNPGSGSCSHRSRNGNRGQPESITVSAMCIMQPVISYPKYIPSYVTQASVPSSSLQSSAASLEVNEENSSSNLNAKAPSATVVAAREEGALISKSGRRSSRYRSGSGSPGPGETKTYDRKLDENVDVELANKSELQTSTATDPQASTVPVPHSKMSKILKVPVINGPSAVVPPTMPVPFTSTQTQGPEGDPEIAEPCSSNHIVETDIDKEGVLVKQEDTANSASQSTSIVDSIIEADILNCSKFETEIQNLLNSVPLHVPTKSKGTPLPQSTSSTSEESRPVWPESLQEWKKLKKYLKTRQSQVKAIEDKLKKREKQVLNQLRTCTKNTH